MRFDFHNPTRLLFGPGRLVELGYEVAQLGRRALVVIGRGSVRRNGVLDRAVASLEKAGITTRVFEGVEPNPRLSTVKKGAMAAREHDADVVVAIGGGSVMDASKVIAAAVFYDGDPWDMMFHGERKAKLPKRALPIVTVPTLAATGSEMNDGAVITNEQTIEKAYVCADCLAPSIAVVDPELTMTVPPDQTAYGVADIITHVTESYFNGVIETPLQDRMVEAVVLTAMEYGPIAVQNGSDLNARTHIQWASIVALNGWVQAGTMAHFPVHSIEHVLSAHHDIPHGAGLAIVSPAWMRFAMQHNPRKFVLFAERVFGVAIAQVAADRLEAFFRAIGCPTRLSEVGIGTELIERYAADAVRVSGDGNKVLGVPPLTARDVVEILRSCA